MWGSMEGWVRRAVLVAGALAVATAAGAGEFPGPSAPAVFSGDFGILLADDMADPASALDSIGTLAGSSFPWGGDFAFPATLPPLPAGSPPADVPPVTAGAGGGFGAAGPIVPEPTPAALLALGLATLAASRRRGAR